MYTVHIGYVQYTVLFIIQTTSSQLRMKSFILTLIVSLFFALACSDDLIWKPKKMVQQSVALIVIQGTQIKPDQYAPLVDVLQNISQYSLWVGIPDYHFDVPEPLEIGSGIDRTLKSMKSMGMNESIPLFFAGHSLGGVILQDYLQNNSTIAKGQILMGSYLLEKYRNVAYKVPTLTIGGELDGLTRVTRIMEAYYHQVLNATDKTTLTNFPVIVINGMTHLQFASGDPPPLVKLRDLAPEISYEDAHRKVATYITAFISLHTGDSSAVKIIASAVQSSKVFLEPIITAYTLEGFYQFKPPCYDNSESSNCTYGCPWTEHAQIIMGGLTEAKVMDKDAFHPVYQINPVHLPHILNNCSKPDSNCVLQTVTVSQNIYETGDNFDTGFISTSASEIKAKLKSRQAIMEAAGYKNVDFNTSDGSPICKMINQESYQWAKRNAGNKTLARFETFGVPMVMGEDKGPYNAGPLWIWTPLSLSKTTNSSGGAVLEVRAPMMRTPTDYFIKASSGFHYCKLLSPARVMEWIYVDGLREYYSLNTTKTSSVQY